MKEKDRETRYCPDCYRPVCENPKWKNTYTCTHCKDNYDVRVTLSELEIKSLKVKIN